MNKFIPIDSELTEPDEKDITDQDSLMKSINIIEKLLRKTLEKTLKKLEVSQISETQWSDLFKRIEKYDSIEELINILDQVIDWLFLNLDQSIMHPEKKQQISTNKEANEQEYITLEKQIQKYEEEIRTHIRTEQQMSLYAESLLEDNEQLKKQNQKVKSFENLNKELKDKNQNLEKKLKEIEQQFQISIKESSEIIKELEEKVQEFENANQKCKQSQLLFQKLTKEQLAQMSERSTKQNTQQTLKNFLNDKQARYSSTKNYQRRKQQQQTVGNYSNFLKTYESDKKCLLLNNNNTLEKSQHMNKSHFNLNYEIAQQINNKLFNQILRTTVPTQKSQQAYFAQSIKLNRTQGQGEYTQKKTKPNPYLNSKTLMNQLLIPQNSCKKSQKNKQFSSSDINSSKTRRKSSKSFHTKNPLNQIIPKGSNQLIIHSNSQPKMSFAFKSQIYKQQKPEFANQVHLKQNSFTVHPNIALL